MDEWSTPQAFFDLLDREFGFELDPCATQENAKCRQFITKEQDALSMVWPPGATFINPPYGEHGRDIHRWVERAVAEHIFRTVVILLPVRVDTAWWRYCVKANEIRFMRNRLYFSNGGRVLRAPFATCLWVFYANICSDKTRLSVMVLPKEDRGWNAP